MKLDIRYALLMILACCEATSTLVPNSDGADASARPRMPNSVGSRIMGGYVVDDIADFCYQVGIKLKVGANYGWCGGSIISRRAILTAAHCFRGTGYNVSEGTLYAGIINRDHPESGSIVIDFTIDDVVVHDQWDDKLKTNDIAVINLNKSLEFSERICGIDLVSNRDAQNTFENTEAAISGWGRSNDQPENYEPDMKFAKVKIMNLQQCQQKLWQASATNICVYTDNMTGACKGDSGGPLVISVDNSFKVQARRQIGITSFTSRGCVQNFPRVYTRVGSYLGWICKKAHVCEIIFPDE